MWLYLHTRVVRCDDLTSVQWCNRFRRPVHLQYLCAAGTARFRGRHRNRHLHPSSDTRADTRADTRTDTRADTRADIAAAVQRAHRADSSTHTTGVQ